MGPSGEHASDIRARREQGVYIQVLETDGEQARCFNIGVINIRILPVNSDAVSAC
jgi:hypothetical protein